MDYERRHGYRGPEGFIDMPAAGDDRDQTIDDALTDHPDNGELVAAVVTAASPKQVKAQLVDGTVQVDDERRGLALSANALSRARRVGDEDQAFRLDRAL